MTISAVENPVERYFPYTVLLFLLLLFGPVLDLDIASFRWIMGWLLSNTYNADELYLDMHVIPTRITKVQFLLAL